ncbi:MAG: hypothetical protein GIW99_01860 [Candidatus Eremiobacteraeota bacterium]|nr:hypothetical protein [Candidatus Eremiobacteraeota bacterium]MBC5826421.1 hypothetical protein [Candidatus Eremiobacteraeota bacterium]
MKTGLRALFTRDFWRDALAPHDGRKRGSCIACGAAVFGLPFDDCMFCVGCAKDNGEDPA